MHVEEKRVNDEIIPSKLSDIINLTVKHHERFQRADKLHRNVKQRMKE